MFRSSLLFLLLSSALFAAYELRNTYLYEQHAIMSTTLFPSLDKEFKLFSIAANKTKKRVKSSEIVAAFAKHDIEVSSGKHRYINFIKKSPIDTAELELILSQKYLNRYPSLQINKLTIRPRSYTAKLPESYTFDIAPKSLRHSNGTFFLKTEERKRLFFDYAVDAVIEVVHAKNELGRDEELTSFNTTTIPLPFSQIRKEPLTSIRENRYRLKHKVKALMPISKGDVEPAPMVKRGKNITVEIKSGAVVIEFNAIARQDGALHDIISVQKPDGQRVKAKVTGFNRVEIQ